MTNKPTHNDDDNGTILDWMDKHIRKDLIFNVDWDSCSWPKKTMYSVLSIIFIIGTIMGWSALFLLLMIMIGFI